MKATQADTHSALQKCSDCAKLCSSDCKCPERLTKSVIVSSCYNGHNESGSLQRDAIVSGNNKCHLSNSCAWNWFTHVSSEFIEVNACSIAVCIGNQLMLFTSGDTSSLTSACDLKLAKGV